jgi:hypothetical protein
VADATREQIIRIVVENAQAVQQQTAYHNTVRKQINQTQAAQDKADQAYVRSIKLQERAAKQLENSRLKGIKAAQAEQDKADNAYVAGVSKNLRSAKQLDDQKLKGIKAAEAAQQKSENAYVSATLKRLRSEKQVEAERLKGIKAAEREQERSDAAYVRGVLKRLSAEKRLEEEKQAAALAEQASADSAMRNVLAYGGALIGLGSAAAVLGTLREGWSQVADEAQRAAAAAGHFQKESRVSGTLTGKTAAQISPDILKLMVSSGLQQNEADNLYRQFYGSLPAGLQKGNIDEKTAKELLAETAVTAARQGGDAGVKGDLAGILPMFGKVESAEQGLGQLEAIRQGLTEGRGDDTPLTRSLLNVAGTMVREGGPVGSLEEMAALIGTTSLSAGPMMADTRAIQVMKGVRGTTGKQMEKIEKEFGLKQGNTLSLEDRLDAIVPKLREVAKTEDPMAWLTKHIGTPQEDAQAMVELMSNYEVLKKRFASARQSSKGGADVKKQNQEFLDSSLGRQMVSQSMEVAGEYEAGVRNQDALAIVASAKARHAAEPASLNKWLEEKGSSVMGFMGGWDRDTIEASQGLKSQAQRAGLLSQMPEGGFGEAPLDVIQKQADFLRSRGQDPNAYEDSLAKAGIKDPLNRLVELQEKMVELQKQANDKAAGGKDAPVPSKPLTASPPKIPGRPGG